MKKITIIAAFERAEKDWERPQRWWQKDRHIKDGLCYYFHNRLNLGLYEISLDLRVLWNEYKTIKHNAYDFNNREERLEAIRKVLNDLKKQQ